MLTEEIQNKLVERLKRIDPYKIILFGSHAYGNPRPESDIDILVITKDEGVPNNFAEKNALYLRVSDTITEIEKMVPIDLIVHTKAMHKKFIDMGSGFSKKITSEGRVLYEGNH